MNTTDEHIIESEVGKEILGSVNTELASTELSKEVLDILPTVPVVLDNEEN
jgi:hypothetical protein